MDPSPPRRNPPQDLKQRLDRTFGEINAVLLAVALGLAMLDLTAFSALRLSDELMRAQQHRQAVEAPSTVAAPVAAASEPPQ
ncbi:MAG TPA: hypothetical protein VNF04_02230 [Stellaceae bacterium]|nr:hypothetical protein [Stellaceae bacterium]